MNYLVYLDPQAGELEKILSGMKSMVVKEHDPSPTSPNPINPGDSLYFLRGKNDCSLRVRAAVVRVIPAGNDVDEDLIHTLKKMQARLQLTENQFTYWSAKKQVQLVEFRSAQKIAGILVAVNKITNRSDWIAFEDFNQITGPGHQAAGFPAEHPG